MSGRFSGVLTDRPCPMFCTVMRTVQVETSRGLIVAMLNKGFLIDQPVFLPLFFPDSFHKSIWKEAKKTLL